jgi:hypothetical protein
MKHLEIFTSKTKYEYFLALQFVGSTVDLMPFPTEKTRDEAFELMAKEGQKDFMDERQISVILKLNRNSEQPVAQVKEEK